MTVSVKITQWGEGVISVNLDITIYQLKILMAAKVNNFILLLVTLHYNHSPNYLMWIVGGHVLLACIAAPIYTRIHT